jgi:hypothetical protein
MAIKVLTKELGEKMIRRVLIIGGPNTCKTTAIVRTADKPLHILSFPGEKGTGAIPTTDPSIKGYIWEEEDAAQFSISKQIEDIERTTWDILSGKHGEVKTFAGDGLHKLASLYWNREYQKLLDNYATQIAQGKTDRNGLPLEEGLKLAAYGNVNYGSCKAILQYITRVNQSNVHTVMFTCWEGVETEDKEMTGSNARHVFAELPGKLARLIVGEFGVVLYATVDLPIPDPKNPGQVVQKGAWQIRKAGRVWGVGAKVPYELALKLPEKIPQDWQKLYPLLAGVVQQTKAASS